MNIHEHQAKKILQDYGVSIPAGVVITNINNISEEVKIIKSKKLVLKA